MTKLLIIFTLFSLIINCFGQNTDISNKKTDKHINIPGTRLFIIPPAGFTLSKGFLGFQKGNDAVIQIYELEGGNFYTNARSMNRENFEKSNMEVYEFSELHFNNYPAKYLYTQGPNLLNSHQMTFGDSTFSVMIMTGFYPEDKETGKQLKESLLSAYYDPELKINPFATANFTIDESLTRFKFNQFSSNIYRYTLDGKDSMDKFSPQVMITQLPVDETTTFESMAESMINGLKQNTFIHTDTPLSAPRTVNGFNGYEKIIKGYFNRKKVTVYYLIFKQKDYSLVFMGMSHAEDESDLNDFKKLAQTIQLK